MFSVVDPRYGTQFLNFIPHFSQFSLLISHVYHIIIFIVCLYFLLKSNFKSETLGKISNYSFGIFLVHTFFHDIVRIYVFPNLSIFSTSLNFYIILFLVMFTTSYFTIKMMLKNRLTAFIVTGKMNTD